MTICILVFDKYIWKIMEINLQTYFIYSVYLSIIWTKMISPERPIILKSC